jgi:hypothetical protein
MNILLPIDSIRARAARGAVMPCDWWHEGLQARFLLVNVQEPATLYEMVTAHRRRVMLENVSHSRRRTRLSGGAKNCCSRRALPSSGNRGGHRRPGPCRARADRGARLRHGHHRLASAMGLLRKRAVRARWRRTLIHDSPVPVLLVKPPEPSDADVEPDGNGDGDAE